MRRFVLLIVLLIILVGCAGPEGQLELPDATGGSSMTVPNWGELILVEYEGMPCVIYDGFEAGGVTCDFTKFKGFGN